MTLKVVRALLIGGVLVLGAGADASPPSYAPAPSLHRGILIPLAPLGIPPIYQLPLATLDLYDITLDT